MSWNRDTAYDRWSRRKRLNWRGEAILALLPTMIVMLVFAFVQIFSAQRLLFVSLASSAFLIYLDPQHATNRVRTLILAQGMAAVLGSATYWLFGPGYMAGGSAMIATIVLMVTLDAVHPPAVSTALSFAFRSAGASSLLLFALAVGMTALLVGLEQSSLWVLARLSSTTEGAPGRM